MSKHVGAVSCARCGGELPPGAVAYAQVERKIIVTGKRATITDIEVIVCEGCAPRA